ncbi:hypothetical protein STCU_09859 [Strigomonas culicis]|uniref:UDENN FLCN/SMCR8-type domain-containing protein n=1 Tax=Strigomonas culicis TaxID=28005 RepID=S9TPP5_9TRYP|nr:hypothetical protein STCU_09859 [Strigomonas culicis]|eukprot:EPY18609.1 hypothetical protein STCU_09859 [Strigomonas culicis]
MDNYPTILLGEFDSLLGPHVVFASECFHHPSSQDISLFDPLQPQLRFLDGDVLIGSHIASGTLRASYKEYARDIAARVLTSYENRRDCCVFADCGCPAVGSFSFNLHDILARGEQRRFCIIILHSSYEEILASWSLLTFFCKALIQVWQKQAHQRYTAEYSSMSNLEHLREKAREVSLRTFFQLILQESESDDEVRRRVHCQFEQLLITAFDSTASGKAPHTSSWILLSREQAEREMLHRVEELPLSSPTQRTVCSSTEAIVENTAVKPLSVWLVEHLLDSHFSENSCLLDSRPLRLTKSDAQRGEEISLLLSALLSGNQIVISGDSANDTASLALSLAYVLPPPLVKLFNNSAEYRMPYQSRLLSFSEQFLREHEIVTSVATSASAQPRTSGKGLLNLSTIEVEGLVHVRMETGCIASVELCASDAAPGRPSTLVTRLLDLATHTAATVRLPASPVPSAAAAADRTSSLLSVRENVALLKLLMVQVQQLVSEYTTRGRVYTALFRAQEIEANAHILSDHAAPRREQVATGMRGPEHADRCHRKCAAFLRGPVAWPWVRRVWRLCSEPRSWHIKDADDLNQAFVCT